MARLPITGSDDNTWGDILNAYLLTAHNGDGTIKTSALTAAGGEVTSNKGVASGYAALNGSGVVPTTQLATGSGTTSNFLRGDGSWATPPGGSATPGGSNTQLQYNNNGAFGGVAGLTTDGSGIAGSVYSASGADVGLVTPQFTAFKPIQLRLTGTHLLSGTTQVQAPDLGIIVNYDNTGNIHTWVQQ